MSLVEQLGNRIAAAEDRFATSHEHPRLFFGTYDLSSLRLISTPVRELARKFLYSYVEKHRDDPLLPPGTPIRELPGGKWDIDNDRLLGAQSIKFNVMCQFLAFCHLLRQEPSLVETARKWTLAAARWEHHGGLNPYDNDLACAMVITGMSRAYDWLYPFFTEEEKGEIEEALAGYLAECCEMLSPSPRYYQGALNNHAWWTTESVIEGALALLGKHAEAASWLKFGLELYMNDFLQAAGPDGSWHEGLTYVGMVITPLQKVVTLLDKGLGIGIKDRLDWLRLSSQFLLYCNPPWTEVKVEFGNIAHFRSLGHVLAMQKNACLYDDGHAQWHVDRLDVPEIMKRMEDDGDIFALVDLYLAAERQVQAKPPTDLPLSRHFRNVGWAVMHSEWGPGDIMLSFKSGRFIGYDSAHDHADQNHFVLSQKGERMVVDSGVYEWFGSPHFMGWHIQTKAHNAILVDGQGQQAFMAGADGQIMDFLTCPLADYVVGDAIHTFARLSGVRRYVRHMFYRKGEYVLIFDDLRHCKEVSWSWLLHSLEQMEMEPTENAARVSKGQERLWVRWFEPSHLKYSQTNEYDVPLGPPPEGKPPHPGEWHLTVTMAHRLKECQFLTLLVPYRESTPVNYGAFQQARGDGVLGLHRAGAGGEDWIIFDAQSGELPQLRETGPVRFRGKMVGLCDLGGDLPSVAFASRSRLLQLRGQPILSSARPVSAMIYYDLANPALYLTIELPTTVEIFWPDPVSIVTWQSSGRSGSWEYDSHTRILSLAAPEGEHEIHLSAY